MNNMKYSNEFVAEVLRYLLANNFKYAETGRKYGIDRQLITSWYGRYAEQEKRKIYDWTKIKALVEVPYVKDTIDN